MIWAAKVEPGKPLTTNKLEVSIRLSNVALVKLGQNQQKCSLFMEFEGKDYLLCTLTQANPQHLMDLPFDPEDELVFKTKDGGTVDLVGSEEPDEETTEDSSDAGDETSESSAASMTMNESPIVVVDDKK